MKTIQYEVKNELVIKKSKFITFLYPVSSKEECENHLKKIKSEYKGANHYCYAYKIDSTEKCSDDGEPSKTAGLPMLNVLKNEDMNHILCIVVRYFGGIKLGASGLIHAYQDSVKEIVLKTEFIECTEGYLIQTSFSYDQSKNMDYILKDYRIIEKKYDEKITYTFEIEKDKLRFIQDSLTEFQIIKNIYTEKK